MPYARPKLPTGGVKATFPGFIEPALATSIDKVPTGERWVHEIKFDGYRVQVHLRDAAVKIFTGRGNEWTNRFRKIASDAWHINAGSAIIDGKVVAPKIAHRGVWVEPSLPAEIEYRTKSAEGKVRHPSFKGLRED
jgi:ATP-dependent DNA ligase